MSRRPLDPAKLMMRVTATSAPLLEPLTTYGPSAKVIGALTKWEADWRRALEGQQRRMWGAYGLATSTDTARLEEQTAAIPAVGGQNRPSSRKRVPIHWHEGSDGPALLLINGWTASGLVWPSQWLNQLEERFHVIRLDNRGSGWSRTARTPFTIADMADDAAAVLRVVGATSAVVLGHSMGGMIAQELALRHAELVERLVIVASQPPAPRRIASPAHVMRRMMQPPDGQPLHAFIASTWGEVCGPDFAATHPDVLDELADQVLRRPTPRALLLQQMRAISGWSGARRLAHIVAPTVVVHGDADRLMPVGNGMRLAQLIPQAQYVELSGVGHLVPQESPDALLSILRADLG